MLARQARPQMIIDHKRTYERYWLFDVEKALPPANLTNTNKPLEEQASFTEFYDDENIDQPKEEPQFPLA